MICTWALRHVLGLCAARPVPPAPGGSFQTGLQMLLAAFCYDLDPWQTGMWQRSLVSEKLSSEKFFTRKCKEGVHINGMPCNAAFSDPGSHCLLSHKRKESTLWVEKSGNWGWIDNRIRDYQVWALKGERSKLSPPNGGATTLKPFPVQLRCVAWPLSHDRPRTSQLPGGWMFTQDMPARYQPPQGPITDPAYYSGTIS